MAKGKSLFYSVTGKYPLNVYKYSNAELFCEDAQDTAWCHKDFFNEYVSPLLKFGEVYIINDEAEQGNRKKMLIVRSPNFVRLFDTIGITQKGLAGYAPAQIEELLDTNPDNFNHKVKLFFSRNAGEEIFEDVPNLSRIIYREPLGESILIFNYDDDMESFYDILNIDEDDFSVILCALNDKDYQCELENVDYYIEDSFLAGHSILPNYFPDGSEAKELASKIYFEIKPDFHYDDDDSTEVNSFLFKIAQNDIRDFFNYYTYYYDRSSWKAVANAINNELDTITKDTGFVFNPMENTISTTLANLYYYIVANNLVHLSLPNALRKLGNTFNSVKRFGGWSDAKYDLVTDQFLDYSAFELSTLPILNNIKNTISQGNINVIRDILVKYDLETNRNENKHPKTGERYWLRDIDTENGTVTLSNSGWGGKSWEMTFEEFKDWLENDDAVLESKEILLSLQQILENDSRKNRAPKVGIGRSNSNSSGR